MVTDRNNFLVGTSPTGKMARDKSALCFTVAWNSEKLKLTDRESIVL